MPKNKKKLKGVTFQLVDRSQQDPLIADDTAPQRVLVPVVTKSNDTKTDKKKRIEEQQKYGIYFDDDHNYLQYLKDRNDRQVEWPDHVEEELKKRQQTRENAKIQLPSSVFASTVEEDEGMLSKAAPVIGPQLHLDPDLVAAMDDDFDYDDPDNQLEEDFIALAEGVASDEENDFEEHDVEVDSNFSSDDMDMSTDEPEKSFKKEETKSKLTKYSLTSAVLKRNENLQLLDRRFEQYFEKFDDSDDDDDDFDNECEVEWPADEVLDDWEADLERIMDKSKPMDDAPTDLKAKILQLHALQKSKRPEYVELVVKSKPKDNCLSLYKKLHVEKDLCGIIDVPSSKIKVDKRTGIPKNVLDPKLTREALDQFNQENPSRQGTGTKSVADQSMVSRLSTLSIREKNETAEERRARKKAFHEYKKERRLEKKATKEMFKEHRKRQSKIAMNNMNNVQGNRIL